MKHLKTFETRSISDYNVGDKIVLVRPIKYDLKIGLKKGGIYTIFNISNSNTYPIQIKENHDVSHLALYQIQYRHLQFHRVYLQLTLMLEEPQVDIMVQDQGEEDPE